MSRLPTAFWQSWTEDMEKVIEKMQKIKWESSQCWIFFRKIRIQILLPVWEVMSDLILIIGAAKNLNLKDSTSCVLWLAYRNVQMNYQQNFFSLRAFIIDFTAASSSAFAAAQQESAGRIRAQGVVLQGLSLAFVLLQASFYLRTAAFWICWYEVSKLQICNLSCSGECLQCFWTF